MLVTTRSTPIRRAAMKVSPTPSSAATPSAARRASWPRPLRTGVGSSEGRRRAGTGGEPSIGTSPRRRANEAIASAAAGAGALTTARS